MSSERSHTRALRLYRGLTRTYDPARVDGDRPSGTDFTDCPYIALGYATGRNGIVLVLDVPERSVRVTEEFWLGVGSAKRYMIWGRFDALIVASIPATELRASTRRAGVGALSDEDKGMLLRGHLDARLAARRIGRSLARSRLSITAGGRAWMRPRRLQARARRGIRGA